MDFNFELIAKNQGRANNMPSDILRLSGKRYAISPNVASRLHGTRKPSSVEYIGSIKLAFAYDPSQKAIKVSTSEGGFTANYYDNDTIVGRTPSGLAAQAPVGDYRVVDDQSTIFVLAE